MTIGRFGLNQLFNNMLYILFLFFSTTAEAISLPRISPQMNDMVVRKLILEKRLAVEKERKEKREKSLKETQATETLKDEVADVKSKDTQEQSQHIDPEEIDESQFPEEYKEMVTVYKEHLKHKKEKQQKKSDTENTKIEFLTRTECKVKMNESLKNNDFSLWNRIAKPCGIKSKYSSEDGFKALKSGK